jgi:hypothetical protein
MTWYFGAVPQTHEQHEQRAGLRAGSGLAFRHELNKRLFRKAPANGLRRSSCPNVRPDPGCFGCCRSLMTPARGDMAERVDGAAVHPALTSHPKKSRANPAFHVVEKVPCVTQSRASPVLAAPRS